MRAFSSQDRSKLHSLADSLSTDSPDWQLPLQSIRPFRSLPPLWFDEPIVFLQPCREREIELITLDKYICPRCEAGGQTRPGRAWPASSSNIFHLGPVLHLAVWQKGRQIDRRTDRQTVSQACWGMLEPIGDVVTSMRSAHRPNGQALHHH